MTTHQKTRSRLRIEPLEARDVPAVWNNPWPDPEHLTVSFAPDGTRVGAFTSSLHNHLGGLTPAVWQGEVMRAFQTWAAVTNVNFSVVADAGRPFDEAGPLQGSPLFGDIRVAARPLAPSELAVAIPFDLIGTGAGDIALNSRVGFNVGGTGGAFDLYTVALQEAGHALGVPNSSDPNSVMFTQYRGPRTGLSAGDVASVQALYGVRAADRFEGEQTVFGSLAPLKFVVADKSVGVDPTAGDTPFVAAGDLTVAGDRDVFEVRNPKNSTGFIAELRTTGVSLLNARVSVYTAGGVLVKSAAATDPRTGDLSVSVSNVAADSTYYVVVEAAGTKFSTGRYRLAVGHDPRRAVYPPAPTGLLKPDGHKNEKRSDADALSYVSFDALDTGGSGSNAGSGSGLLAGPADARWDFLERASVETAADKDWYKVESPPNSSGVLVAVVSATTADALDPVVRAYDADGKPLAAEVLSTDRSTHAIQVRGVTGGRTYHLEVVGAGGTGPAAAGSYTLAADFRAKAVEFNTLFAGTLTNAAKQEARQITLDKGKLMHLSLSAADTVNAAAVRTTVYDANNRVVASFVARDGETAATDLYLSAGTYTVKVSAAGQNGAALPNLGYSLRGFVRNDPIGPGAEDPTLTPTGPAPSAPPVVAFPTAAWAFWVDDFSDPWGAA